MHSLKWVEGVHVPEIRDINCTTAFRSPSQKKKKRGTTWEDGAPGFSSTFYLLYKTNEILVGQVTQFNGFKKKK